VAPDPDPEWHPIALRWFEALGRSGQSAFYQESDWLTAFAVAESMSREFRPQPVVSKDGDVRMVLMPPKASALTAWLKAASSLLVMEGDRRRAGLELDLPRADGEEVADVSDLGSWRSRVDGTG
jgi:hypothetical protein